MTDADSQTTTPQSSDKLDRLMYQFVTLYERWAEDRQVMTRQHAAQQAEMQRLVAEFTSQVQAFRQLSPEVEQRFATGIKQTVENVGKNMSQAVHQASTRKIENAVFSLKDVVNSSRLQLKSYRELFATLLPQWIAASLMGSLATATFFVWLFQPTLMPLTQAQVQTLNTGYRFVKVWDTLPKERQQYWDDEFKKLDEKQRQDVQ